MITVFATIFLTYYSNLTFCIYLGKLYLNVFYPVWSHLDERGFGTWQPFVCWLVIPFTLSMIVWYVAVCQLYEISRWEDYMDPLTDYSSLEQEEFVWGEL